jgi:hypothetical protein
MVRAPSPPKSQPTVGPCQNTFRSPAFDRLSRPPPGAFYSTSAVCSVSPFTGGASPSPSLAHKGSTTLVGAKRGQLLMQPEGCETCAGLLSRILRLGTLAARRDDRDDEIARLKSKVGEITMDNELLYAKIEALEGTRATASYGRGCACAGATARLDIVHGEPAINFTLQDGREQLAFVFVPRILLRLITA